MELTSRKVKPPYDTKTEIGISELSLRKQDEVASIDDDIDVFARRKGGGWEITTIDFVGPDSEDYERALRQLREDGWLLVVNA